MISDVRLTQLIAFTSALVEANRLGDGIYEVPLMAAPAEALDVLEELAEWRKTKSGAQTLMENIAKDA